MAGPRRVSIAVAALLTLAGCATSTRTAKMGPLTTGPLVTLIVTDDRAVVERECRDVLALGPILGCSIWRTVQPNGRTDVKMMKVVRYTDALPSALALETPTSSATWSPRSSRSTIPATSATAAS